MVMVVMVCVYVRIRMPNEAIRKARDRNERNLLLGMLYAWQIHNNECILCLAQAIHQSCSCVCVCCA